MVFSFIIFLLLLFQILQLLLELATSPSDAARETGNVDDFALVEAVVTTPNQGNDTPMEKRELVSPGFVDVIFQLLGVHDIRSTHDIIPLLLEQLEKVVQLGR